MTPYKALEQHFRQINDLAHVFAVLYWDEATMMPLGGGPARANAMAALADEGRMTIATWEKDSDTVAASVEDNGCGMSDETCRYIFEPFFTTKKEHGTGLGLSITYGIVQKLGGDIEVKSKENKGTKFTVYLPKKAK